MLSELFVIFLKIENEKNRRKNNSAEKPEKLVKTSHSRKKKQRKISKNEEKSNLESIEKNYWAVVANARARSWRSEN